MSDKESNQPLNNTPFFSSIEDIKKEKFKFQKEEVPGEPHQQTDSAAVKTTEKTKTIKVQ